MGLIWDSNQPRSLHIYQRDTRATATPYGESGQGVHKEAARHKGDGRHKLCPRVEAVDGGVGRIVLANASAQRHGAAPP